MGNCSLIAAIMIHRFILHMKDWLSNAARMKLLSLSGSPPSSSLSSLRICVCNFINLSSLFFKIGSGSVSHTHCGWHWLLQPLKGSISSSPRLCNAIHQICRRLVYYCCFTNWRPATLEFFAERHAPSFQDVSNRGRARRGNWFPGHASS